MILAVTLQIRLYKNSLNKRIKSTYDWASQVTQCAKNPPSMQVTWIPSLTWEDPPEEGMATHSSILVWSVPQTQEPGEL